MRANQMLRQLMKKQGREIQWFAEIIGVSPSQMSYIVNGRKEIEAIPASRVAGALGVPLLFVFDASTDAETELIESMPSMEAA